ncbi:type I phosphomannose isomerase catalytic subunit [Mucilaginibacter sp. 10I4]|uniref:type I phosphomannose isomerase catalytic subunit n=1 Tax=Mucilaginibacter sp. 10I4 TaxID=3048580 RepID=UPI002B2220CE|nr:type I phosphomannose isomerase catalytic subunit [Mucilaginibacter sp. 10I4]MEB0260704.1 class I mannose-6-phosphate isomerase [Mucilaginibacter sp. 10I4]
MNKKPLYPVKFDPIYQYRLWGGRRLSKLLSKPLPDEDPVGEAWLLSDRKEFSSKIIAGDLKDQTIAQLMKDYPEELMGKFKNRFDHFPLLLKFLDCKEVLSVQVHPSDHQKKYIPVGDTGKTEAWVVLDTEKKSRIYAGLVPGTNADNLKAAIQENSVGEMLHSFIPKPGDGIFIHSGTVHTLKGTLVFEVQENSDVTFRLYDWDRTDAKTGKPRPLQVDEAIACIDFTQVNIGPVKPLKLKVSGYKKERFFNNDHFILWRTESEEIFKAGKSGEPRILVCIEGSCAVKFNGADFQLIKGEVMLLPSSCGVCDVQPFSKVDLFEIAITDRS